MIAFRPKERSAIVFHVNDMTCARSAFAIATAVRAIDNGAKVTIDIKTHRVEIEPSRVDAFELCDAINAAGFTPEGAFGGSAPSAFPWAESCVATVAGADHH